MIQPKDIHFSVYPSIVRRDGNIEKMSFLCFGQCGLFLFCRAGWNPDIIYDLDVKFGKIVFKII